MSELSISEILRNFNSASMIGVDAETEGSHPATARYLGSSGAYSGDNAFWFPVDYTEDNGFPVSALKNDSIPKLMHHASFDRSILKRQGIVINNIIDTLILADLIGKDERKDLQHLVRIWVPDNPYIVDYADSPVKPCDMTPVQLHAYSGPHSMYLFPLYERLWSNMTYLDRQVWQQIEQPLIPVLSDMELDGVKIDKEYISNLQETFTRQLAVTEEALNYAANTRGRGVNWNSPVQASHILFNELGYPKTKPLKKQGLYSTTTEELGKIRPKIKAHGEVLDYLILSRHYQKLIGTYCKGLLREAVGDYVHTHYNQASASTGRLSSSGPNLQNIPKRAKDGMLIRGAFVAAPGNLFIRADASQIELKMMAIKAKDPVMLRAFKENSDIHLETAMRIFNDASKRFYGKTLNFSVIYLAGDEEVARQAGTTTDIARNWRRQFFDTYYGIRDSIALWGLEIKESGMARTEFGRRRRIPEARANKSFSAERGVRMGISTMIQGSAAEVVKIGMRRAWEKIKDDPDIKMRLQVHDEVVYEVPEEGVHDYVKMLRGAMTYEGDSQHEFPIPITYEFEIGRNWKDMVEYSDYVKKGV